MRLPLCASFIAGMSTDIFLRGTPYRCRRVIHEKLEGENSGDITLISAQDQILNRVFLRGNPPF